MMGHSIKMALFDPQMRMGTLHARSVVAHRPSDGLAKKAKLIHFKLSHVHSSKEGCEQCVHHNTFIEALDRGLQCCVSANRVINAVHISPDSNAKSCDQKAHRSTGFSSVHSNIFTHIYPTGTPAATPPGQMMTPTRV